MEDQRIVKKPRLGDGQEEGKEQVPEEKVEYNLEIPRESTLTFVFNTLGLREKVAQLLHLIDLKKIMVLSKKLRRSVLVLLKKRVKSTASCMNLFSQPIVTHISNFAKPSYVPHLTRGHFALFIVDNIKLSTKVVARIDDGKKSYSDPHLMMIPVPSNDRNIYMRLESWQSEIEKAKSVDKDTITDMIGKALLCSKEIIYAYYPEWGQVSTEISPHQDFEWDSLARCRSIKELSTASIHVSLQNGPRLSMSRFILSKRLHNYNSIEMDKCGFDQEIKKNLLEIKQLSYTRFQHQGSKISDSNIVIQASYGGTFCPEMPSHWLGEIFTTDYEEEGLILSDSYEEVYVMCRDLLSSLR